MGDGDERVREALQTESNKRNREKRQRNDRDTQENREIWSMTTDPFSHCTKTVHKNFLRSFVEKGVVRVQLNRNPFGWVRANFVKDAFTHDRFCDRTRRACRMSRIAGEGNSQVQHFATWRVRRGLSRFCPFVVLAKQTGNTPDRETPTCHTVVHNKVLNLPTEL